MSPEHLTNVIRRAQAGEAGAFDEMIDVFGPRLYGFLHRLCGSADEAEDLLQELFLRVVRSIGRYRHEDQFEAWLFRIATNLVRDQVRRLRRRPAHQSLHPPADRSESAGEASVALLPDTSAASPERVLTQRDDIDRLQQALARLPVAEREVVMLRHFSQLSFQQIAEAMGTPLGTALARAHRGLAKLRTLMEPNG